MKRFVRVKLINTYQISPIFVSICSPQKELSNGTKIIKIRWVLIMVGSKNVLLCMIKIRWLWYIKIFVRLHPWFPECLNFNLWTSWIWRQQRHQLKEILAKQNRKAYIIPVGGSCPIGCLGYVKCAEEIISQAKNNNVNIDGVVVANGSSGTHAGLLAGFKALKSDIKVYGYCVVQDKENTVSLTQDLANKTLEFLGYDGDIKFKWLKKVVG